MKESPEAFETLKGLTQESSVIVTGKIRAEKRAPGGYEIGVSKIQVIQKVPESTPFPRIHAINMSRTKHVMRESSVNPPTDKSRLNI